MIQVVIFGLLVQIHLIRSDVKLAGGNAGTVETTELFKTVASITFKNGNTDSAVGQAAAGKVKRGKSFLSYLRYRN